MPILDIPDVWPIASISMNPEISLCEWRVFEVKLPNHPGKTRHFVGYSVGDRAGQVSSPIRQFDPDSMQGITESGRVYKLIGKPGWDADAEHTWLRWKSICSITGEVDVTGSIRDGLLKERPRV